MSIVQIIVNYLLFITRGHATCLKLSPNLRKTSRVPEAMRSVDVETEKLERVMTLMKK